MYSLYKFNHGSVRGGTDWGRVFGELFIMWDQNALQTRADSVDRRPWSDSNVREYTRYMREIGAAEYPVSRAEAYARRRQQSISEVQYTPVAPKVHSQVCVIHLLIYLLIKIICCINFNKYCMHKLFYCIKFVYIKK